MRISKTAPQKIVVTGSFQSYTCNDIKDALKEVARLLQSGTVTIEIENVSAKIAEADWHDQQPEYLK